jgi:hypothetical protein
MIKAKKVSSPIYTFFPTEVEGFDSLAELALDMRWSWNHSADEVWGQIDTPPSWRCGSPRSRSNPMAAVNRLQNAGEPLAKVACSVIPAKAGIQNCLKNLDSGSRFACPE